MSGGGGGQNDITSNSMSEEFLLGVRQRWSARRLLTSMTVREKEGGREGEPFAVLQYINQLLVYVYIYSTVPTVATPSPDILDKQYYCTLT
jgi:hypothetical protein